MDLFTDFPFADLQTQSGFVDAAQYAGYTGVFATENKHDPFLPIAAAARRERSIQLGTGVIAMLAHNPFTVAQMAWDLHYNTGERFILGVCTHQDLHLTARLGVRADHKHERLVEAIAAVREIWAAWLEDRDPHYAGRYYSIHVCPKGYRPTSRLSSLPPVFHLCATEEDLRVADLFADGIFLHPTWIPAYVNTVVQAHLASWSARTGRPLAVIDGGIIATGLNAEGLNASREQARKRIASYWLKREYDYVYDAVSLLSAIERFRDEECRGAIDWNASYIDELFHAFVCEAPLKDLGRRIKIRSSEVVTGLFPNIVSDVPRLLPPEFVSDIRRIQPRQAA